MSQRYKRFRKNHSKELEEIGRDIGELWAEREKGVRVDLIPYLIARRKARIQLLAREYQERFEAGSELNAIEEVLSHINRLAPEARKPRG